MNYGAIKPRDIANGIGVRVSVFVSGCTHHCKNCFNAETWDFGFGEPFTKKTEDYILEQCEPSFIAGLSLLGGEPFEPKNQEGLLTLLRRFKKQFPEKTVWCYSGYTLEKDLLSESRARCEFTDEMLSYIDVLVDGEFVEELKNIRLKFRGSENQRLINLKETLKQGKIILMEL